MAALAVVPGALFAAAKAAATTGRSTELARDAFKPLLGQTLRMTTAGQETAVVLTKIRDLTPVLRPDDQKRFALMFRPAGNDTGSQDPVGPIGGVIRSFSHEDTGSVSLFAAPVGPASSGPLYEAVINRL